MVESNVDLKYGDGRLNGIVMPNAEKMEVTDCRDSQPSFLGIHVRDEQVEFKAFVEPEAAESLTKELVKLFPTATPRPTFSLALGQIGDYLATKDGGLSATEQLAIDVLKRACYLAKQDAEHKKLSL